MSRFLQGRGLSDDPASPLADILDNCDRIAGYIQGLDRSGFERDGLKRDMVERCLERICEGGPPSRRSTICCASPCD
jgi:hypothetical protein